MDTPTNETMQTSNQGLDQTKCLTCQKNPANPPHIPSGQQGGPQVGGILCRACQRKVVESLNAHENLALRAEREAADKAHAERVAAIVKARRTARGIVG